MNARIKWAGVVVLYHPASNVIHNIMTYCTSLDMLIVYDNTETPSPYIKDNLKKIPTIKYVAFKENNGLAKALNTALHMTTNYDYLLTMDQDSSFPNGMFEYYKKMVEHWNDNKVAVFGVNYDGVKKTGWEFQKKVITSGSVLSIGKANIIGGFDENLFIDEVDHEYCYHARKLGYRVIMLNDIHLKHRLGERKEVISLFGKKKYDEGVHSPLRTYYIFRNAIYIIFKYPSVLLPYMSFIRKRLCRILFGYQYQRKQQLMYACRGIHDAICGNMGKIHTNQKSE